jgi:hypothetical protein
MAIAVAGAASCSSGSTKVTCASSAACASAPPPGGTSSALQPFTAPTDPGPGGVLFTASGEALAISGYAFPPASDSDPAFVDGWDVRFTRLLVTFDNIALSQNPNIRPGDQSCTEPTVATVTGPWAVDLAHHDPNNLPGKGGAGEEAVPIVALARQNYPAGNGAAFDTGGTPYAFGFDAIPATGTAKNVNLDGGALADYMQMIADQCVVLYVGTATFNGASCTCPGSGLAGDACPGFYQTDWPQMGQSVPFRLCFKSPTTYVNCQNPDNMGAPLSGEEAPRGLLFSASQSIVAQVTFHTDHPFWDSVLHDSPAHFDQFAATVAGMGQGGVFPAAKVEPTRGISFTAYKDARGNALNWRYCIAPPTDVHDQFNGPMNFDRQSVPQTSGTDACMGLRDYYDFATYNQSTQGHLNSDGLCYVDRHYPSPR